jgi:mono/diheme cytochrome c family protein
MRVPLLPPLAAVLAIGLLTVSTPPPAEEDAETRGEYLVRAGGCFSCHTAPGGQKMGGGRALTTPFGTFYSPNITPDPETGIGRWTDTEFLRALREGVRPDGTNYFPVFPYPSFTGITDSDALAIKAYLFSLPAVRQQNRPHNVPFPFSWRFLQTGWKLLFFTPGPFQPAIERSAAYNRGAYLVTALAHCGECHTLAISSAPRCPASGWPGRRMGPTASSFPILRPIRALGSASGKRMTSSSC